MIKNIVYISFALMIISGIIFSLFGYDTKAATRVLEDNMYTEIKINGRAYFYCGKEDFYATKFEAKNIKGKSVEGAVCGGLFFKGSTIRF